MSTPPEPDALWIHTEPTLDGSTYVVTLALSDDYALTLTPARATAYAVALLSAVADAEYDQAVYRQLVAHLRLDADVALATVSAVRTHRPPVREAGGVRFVPGVSQARFEPFIVIHRSDDTPVGQLDAAHARRHAIAVLEAPRVAELDTAFHRTLRDVIEVPEGTAREAVSSIATFRQPWRVVDDREEG